jgi:hypothetical protein
MYVLRPLEGTRPLFETQRLFSWDTGEPPASKQDRRLIGGGFYSSMYGTLPSAFSDSKFLSCTMYMYTRVLKARV